MNQLNVKISKIVYTCVLMLLCLFQSVAAKTLTTDTIIAAGDYTYIEEVIVPTGVSLTIEAGATLRFNAGNGLLVQKGGTLYVTGEEGNPVIFTSDELTAGSWSGITFEGGRADGNELVIEHAIIEYADKALYTNKYAVKATVTNTTVRYNNYGVYVNGAWNEAPYYPIITFTDGFLHENVHNNYYTESLGSSNSEVTIIDATGNWWGTGQPLDISSTIYDRIDTGNAATIDFSGYLTSVGDVATRTRFIHDITADTVWSTSNGVLTQPIHVTAGNTLTITAGTQIDAMIGAELIIDKGGKLHVQGTSDTPVIFTSSNAVIGSWTGITFEGSRVDGSDIVIDHAIIEYADKALCTKKWNVKVTVTNSTVRYNNYGVYVSGAWSSAPKHPIITFTEGSLYDNVQYNYYTELFSGNTTTTIDVSGNWWGTNQPQDIAASIYDRVDAENTASINFSGYLESENGVALGTSFTNYITEDTTWSASDGILAQPIHVLKGNTLTIAEGTKIDAVAGAGLIVDAGAKLQVQGTSDAPVLFTSSNEVAGSWSGLTFEGASVDGNDIIIDYAIIEYADKALYTQKINAKVTVTNSTVRYNNYGVYINGVWSLAPNHPIITFTDGALHDNVNYNYYTKSFGGNTVTTIDASGNWWGTSNLTQTTQSIWDVSDGTYKPQVNFSRMLTSNGGHSLPGTHILGNISGEHHWSFNDGVVLADTLIKSGANVIVESGTLLEFFSGAKLTIEKGAKFTVMGEKSSPVTFTSGNATKTVGDWGGIEVQNNSDITISNAIIEYADSGLLFTGEKISGSVTNSTIENNNIGIHVNAFWQTLDNHPTPVITNNIIRKNINYNYYAEKFSDASSRILNARGNYWGVTDNAAIAQSIFDNTDNVNSPIIDYGYARADENTTVVADAGLNSIAYGSVRALLLGKGRSEMPIIDYSWQQYLGDAVTINNDTQAIAHFTVSDDRSEELLSFMLSVTDANAITATDKLNILVKPFSLYNQEPIVADSETVVVADNELVSVTLMASDSPNNPLSYAWQQISGETISLVTTDTNTLTFTPPSNIKNQLYGFKLTVSDGNYSVERIVEVAVKASEATSGTYYFHSDHLGTPQVMTDDNADIVWQANYTPFGEASISIESITNNIRFPGQYFDEESGLHYNYFRDYDPELGRYIQSDPIGLAGGINTYGYALGNPIKYTDPLGLDICLQNTTAVYGLHQRITVKNSDGSYGQSFGLNQDGDGEVYSDNRDKTTSETCTASTKKQDEAAIKRLKSQLGDKGFYNPLFSSCRDYSQREYSIIKINILNQKPNVLTRPSKGLF